jgi:hypothetical protein
VTVFLPFGVKVLVGLLRMVQGELPIRLTYRLSVAHERVNLEVGALLKIYELASPCKRTTFAAGYPFAAGHWPCAQGIGIRFKPGAPAASYVLPWTQLLVLKKGLEVFMSVGHIRT